MGGDPRGDFRLGSGNLVTVAPMSSHTADPTNENEDVKLEWERVEEYLNPIQMGEQGPVSYKIKCLLMAWYFHTISLLPSEWHA